MTASIAALNVQIQGNDPNTDAGTLEDQRQQDLTQLSQYIGFNQTTTENNGLTLTTSNGALLVSEGQSYALGTSVVAGKVDVTSAAGQDITTGLTGGQLGGVLQARDVSLPAVSTSLDQLAYAIGNQVNTQNEAGLDANGVAGAAIFTLPASAAGAAAGIAVATTDPSAIAAASTSEGSTGDTNATALSGLQTVAIVGGQTADGFFASFLTQLGTSVSTASANSTAQQASLTQLTTQRDSLSGVSLDEEAASLTQYQRSYEAASKVFSIIDQLLASALNLGEETTVS